MNLYDRVAGLDVEIDELRLERRELEVSGGFTRVTTTVVLAAYLLFATARGTLAGPLLAMSLLGLGGGFSAAMPAVILQVTPEQETASAMGVNQVVRSTGFSLGSTFSALVLAASTAGGAA